MKKLIKPFTISIIILSVIYVCYVAFINMNGLIVGTKIVENKHKVLEVAEMSKTSYGKFVGLKQGDMIVKINNKKPSLKYLKGDTLYHVKSLDIKRNGQQIHLDDFDIVNLNGYYSYFLFVLPLVFYFLSLICIFYIVKVSQTRKSIAGYVLILFLLDISIAYMSAGGPSRGHEFNRYINLFTFIASPIFYLQFIQEYFKELGKKFANRLISFLYIIPIINLLNEPFRHIYSYDFTTNLNLVSFFFVTLYAFISVFYHLYKFKYSEHAYILKILILTNTLSFLPFLLFYVIPIILTGSYILDALAAASLLVLIPLGLVYQFVANKIFDIEFILGRMRYYGLLALVPALFIVGISAWFESIDIQMNPAQQTVFFFIVIFVIFYFKEVMDYKFRLKRFSEKFNYQDSIFKYTQLIRSITSLKQMFKELKKTILDVLLVSKAYVFEVTSEGDILYHDKKDNEPDWEMYSKEFKKVTSEIGKIIELNRGFLIKIGERGGSSYVLLCLSTINTPRLTRDEISWLKTLSFYTSVSMENVIQIEELMNHLQDLKQQGSNPVWLKKLMFTIEEKQRSDLARDLHDSVLQDLISLKRQCELFLADFKKEEPCHIEVQDKLHQMNEQMSDVILMTRETCHELRPQLLYDLGLVKAVSKLAAQQQERAPFHIRLNTGRFTAALDLDTQLNLYRIIQEFLSNAMKHSQANEVLIMLISIQNKVILHYEDDGVGCNQEEGGGQSMSMGLSGIKERVRALDGRMKIDTSEGNGFKADIEMEL
ncbi:MULTISPECIES: histidine kinase [Bacillus amyloliquefaciens group]|uniref:sensor histidine kinase n=1 Tax=Bacillus amyloliquefaciens group TaxID=1938374 RepID=UPI00086355ED|nr:MULTISPECIES: histidine kinase [Bacillus amyloliquefaciens group]AOU02151.1 histidine kinase [Bacillus velezensis]MCR6616371.1 histidine kinase [Bacillus amyloliquefaciens]NRR26221.1 histidine kinase [Bacillus velezensis]QAV93512.1 histidine kinase [Bacillus velezensis]QAW25985.1 histidine kinase [Bacillus velezensis]